MVFSFFRKRRGQPVDHQAINEIQEALEGTVQVTSVALPLTVSSGVLDINAATTSTDGSLSGADKTKLDLLLYGPDGEILLHTSGTGFVGRKTRTGGPQEDVHLRSGDASASHAMVEAYGNGHLASNCYWDGTNWQRFDIAAQAVVLVSQGASGFLMLVAQPGANPIASFNSFEITADSVGRIHIRNLVGNLLINGKDNLRLMGNLVFDPVGAVFNRVNTANPALDVTVVGTSKTLAFSSTPSGANPATMTLFAELLEAANHLHIRASAASLIATAKDAAHFGSNIYYDGSNWQRYQTSFSATLLISPLNELRPKWYTTPAGANPVTFTGNWPLAVLNREGHSGVKMSGNQAIANGTFTRLNFNTAYNTNRGVAAQGTQWDTTNFRFPVQEDGIYAISAAVHYQSAPDGCRLIVSLYNSGAGEIYRLGDRTCGATTDQTVNGSCTAHLTAGQIVEIQTWQNTGGSLNALASLSYVTVSRVG